MSGINTIGNSAFAYCKNLVEIIIPPSVSNIKTAAFSGCANLKRIVLPSSISIGESTFKDCPIESATIPTHIIKDIPKDKLKSVTVKGGTFIDGFAFMNCKALESATICIGIKGIYRDTFSGCVSLNSVKFEYTEGWRITDDFKSFKENTGGKKINVKNDAKNAKYLTDKYRAFYWY